MLVALSFSSITCFKIVRDDLMASFNVMDCQLPREKRQTEEIQLNQSWWFSDLSFTLDNCAFMRLRRKKANKQIKSLWKLQSVYVPVKHRYAVFIPCGRLPAESSERPQMLSQWPERHTAQRFLMGPCGTCKHKHIKCVSLWSLT